MSKPISVLCFGVVVMSVSVVLGGCGSDAVNSVTTSSSVSSSSSSSSSGEGGKGGAGGAGGMAGTGGAGGGMAGGGGVGGAASACMKPDNGCGACLFDQCQLAFCNCINEPACASLISCVQVCPPNMPDCVGGCYVTNATGFAEFTIASSCSGTLCAPSCPGSEPTKPCDLCLAQKCEPQLEACLANLECFPLIECQKPCNGNMMCEQQCNTMYPNGKPLVDAVFVCASMGCGDSCN